MPSNQCDKLIFIEGVVSRKQIKVHHRRTEVDAMKKLNAFLMDKFPSSAKTGQLGSLEQIAWLGQVVGLPFFGFKRGESHRYRTYILVYCCLILLSTQCIYVGLEVYHLVWSWPNLDAFTHNVSFSFSHWAGLIKAINIYWYFPSIRKIHEKLRTTTQRFVRSKDQHVAFQRGEFENKILLFFYASVILFTGSTGILMLILFPYGIAGERFPYCAKFPEIVTTTLPHRIQLLYMGITVTIIALQVVAVDFLNIALINQIRTQLDVLILSFENINVNVQMISTNSHHTKRTASFECLKSIIQHHCVLIELRNEVQNIYSMPVLLQFLTSLLVFGITGFRATVVSDQENITKDAMIFLYCGCIFLQLIYYCGFGNEVFEKSKSLASNGFGTLWFECDQTFKSAFLIFLMNAQKPFIFSGASFIVLLLPTFTGILSKSYTAIAVLRQIYGK